MNEQTRKKVMYGILIAAIIFGVWNFTHPTKSRHTRSNEVVAAVAAPATTDSMSTGAIDVSSREAMPWGRDPFTNSNASVSAPRPATSRPKQTAPPAVIIPGFRLSGIVYNAKQSVAVINGQMVGEGDEVDNARVQRIDQNKVTIIYNGIAIDLHVSKG
jgi:hypothetical protein